MRNFLSHSNFSLHLSMNKSRLRFPLFYFLELEVGFWSETYRDVEPRITDPRRVSVEGLLVPSLLLVQILNPLFNPDPSVPSRDPFSSRRPEFVQTQIQDPRRGITDTLEPLWRIEGTRSRHYVPIIIMEGGCSCTYIFPIAPPVTRWWEDNVFFPLRPSSPGRSPLGRPHRYWSESWIHETTSPTLSRSFPSTLVFPSQCLEWVDTMDDQPCRTLTD